MRTDSHTQPATSSAQQIPWWNDLDPAIAAELELPDIRTLPAQTIDVIVIGGGVAGLSAALSVLEQVQGYYYSKGRAC